MRTRTASAREIAEERAKVVDLVEDLRSMHADLEEIRTRQASNEVPRSLFRWRDLAYQSEEKLLACQAQLVALLGRLATIDALAQRDVGVS
jgi:hypothetical protein